MTRSDAPPLSAVLARATWSIIAEANDALAHVAVEHVGAETALELVRHKDGSGLTRVLREAGLHDARQTEVERGIARWTLRLHDLPCERIQAAFTARGGHLLVPGEPGWPAALDDLGASRPLCLWVLGPLDLATASATSVALVGSRAATAYGEHLTGDLAADLAADRVLVVSGGAYGIDAAAHRGALAADGATVAILAGGLDELYPRGNARLLEELARRHAVVSESPPHATPTRFRFLARNRLIAALTRATVVTEAAHRSGALSTARRAAELMRPLGAVPGPVTSPTSAGCHDLIRDGVATLVTGSADLLQMIGPIGPDDVALVPDELEVVAPGDRPLFDAVPPRRCIGIRDLALRCGSTPAEVQAGLGRLALLGLVEVTGSGVRRATARPPAGSR